MTLAKFFDANGDCHCDTCCGDTDCTFCNPPAEPDHPPPPVLCSQCRIGPAEFGTLCDYCFELRGRRAEFDEQGDDPCPCCGPDTCTTCHGDGCRDCEPLEAEDTGPTDTTDQALRDEREWLAYCDTLGPDGDDADLPF